MKRLLLTLLFLAACQPEATPLPFLTSAPVNPPSQAQTVSLESAFIPTLDPLPTRTLTRTPTAPPTETPPPSATSSPTIIPTSTFIASPTRGTPNPDGSMPPTWTPPPPDPSMQIADHYVLGRPISSDHTNWVSRTYPYGGTNGGRLQVHHGVDIGNPAGVPILAAADGMVVYAGDDLTIQFGSMYDYYGKLVVLEHDFRTPEGEPLFTLYGHMLNPTVKAGQVVREGDVIGIVGGTGVALGPHLHFEVRVGSPYSFDATRNPELWLRPFPQLGTLAGRVTDAEGQPVYGATLTVASGAISRYAFSYGDDSVNGDPAFGENFTLGDLPADYYTVTVTDSGRVRYQRLIYVYPNRTTWLDVQLSP